VIAAAAWELPTTIAAVLIALGTIVKTVHQVYRWAQRIDSSLAYIESEMRLNGGQTMRDAIKRIEQRLTDVEDNQEDAA
jgi:hypothetical protein